jgi:hypothetical protein
MQNEGVQEVFLEIIGFRVLAIGELSQGYTGKTPAYKPAGRFVVT